MSQQIKPIASKPAAPAKPKDTVIVVKFGFSEGLNFGCGFFVAGALFTIIAVPASMIIATIIGSSLF